MHLLICKNMLLEMRAANLSFKTKQIIDKYENVK